MSAKRIKNTETAGHDLLRAMKRLLLGGKPQERQAEQDIAFLRDCAQFDREGYLQRYPDVVQAGIDPVEHYVRHGAAEGRLPCAGFDALLYTQEHPEIALGGVNPFRHYLEHGAATAWPESHNGTNDLQGVTDTEVIAQSGVFDREGYLAAYPSVASAGVDPVVHYLKHGAKEGCSPCALFSSRYYLKAYPDVAKAKVNPLVHFCRSGFKELRNPHPDFDTAWYVIVHLAGNPDRVNPLAHYLNEGRREGLSMRAAMPMLPAEHQQLRDACDAIVEAAIVDAATCLRLADALEKRKSIALAEKLCRSALSKQWSDAETHARLAALLSRQRKWWQAVDSWQEALKGDETRPEWWFKLGEACEQMHRLDAAVAAFSRATAIKPENGNWWYRFGYAAEKAGQPKLASTAYAEAIKLDPSSGAGRFGVGVFHQARGYWPDAAIAYEKRLRELPLDAELHYRLGMAHDRCYRWDAALASYRRALALNPLGKAYWHYRYGFVLERTGCWNEAARAYAGAIRLSEKPIAYWHYRRAYVLAEAGQYETACLEHIAQRENAFVDGRAYQHAVPHTAGRQEAVTQDLTEPQVGETSQGAAFQAYVAELDAEPLICEAVAADATDASIRYRFGELLENKEDWAGAARAYADALDRSAIYQPKWFYRLGFALFQAGQFEEACRAFRQTYITQRATGIDSAALAKAHPSEVLPATYVEYMESLPLRDNVIVYESHIGKQVSCNPLAIFKYLVNHPDYQSLLHVWVVNDPERVPDDLRKYPNVVFAPRPSDLYLRYLATAKYLVNNTVFPQYFVRRDGQKFLATWHGTPLKTLGKQQQYKFQDHKRAQRNFLQATHIISPNPHTTGVLFDSYDIRHTMGGKLAETGYPRIDLTLNASEARRAEIRAQLGVDGKRPVVLYAPTWRGTLETVSYEVDKAKADLRLLAGRHDCDIVFRGHHLMEKVFGADVAMGCIVAPATLDTNELLSVVDVLITDYSSIFFDFLPTGRPVLYYTYDLEEYSRERGMYFTMDEMPGYKCPDVEVLSQALGKALGGELVDPEHRTAAHSRFNAHDDGRATERVVDFLFNDAGTCVVDPGSGAGKRLLIHGGGFQPNGITTSFLNLTRHIDRSRLHITVPIDSGAMEFDRTARSLFERLPEDIAVVSRHGPVPMTWEERWLRTKYESAQHVFNDEQMAIIKGIFAREYRRIFGTARFDAVITFSGYDAFWASVLNLGADAVRKAIYLHSDIRDEYVAKFPELMRMLRLYPYADVLTCVCEQSRIENTEKLAGWLGIPPGKFISSENVQDPERVLALADEKIDEADAGLFGAGPVFINMGRMSVEKDQAKLIRAFACLAAEHAQPRLLLLGDGPLRGELEALVEQLGVAERIHVLGFRANPYPYLRRSDCFVLSSNHEAKTMSLIESLILGLPFVATDISGNADVKHMLPAHFVDNSEQGLLDGMRSFLDGALPTPDFNWRQHQVDALDQFYSRVVGMEASEVSRALIGEMEVSASRALGADYLSKGNFDGASEVYTKLIESAGRTKNDFENLIICYYSLKKYDCVVSEFDRYSSCYPPKLNMSSYAYRSACVIDHPHKARYLQKIEESPAELCSERHLKLGAKIFYSLADSGCIEDAYAFKRSMAKLFSRAEPFRSSPFVSYQIIAALVFLGDFDQARQIVSKAPSTYEWGVVKKIYNEMDVFCEIALADSVYGNATKVKERLAEAGAKVGVPKEYAEADSYFKKLVFGKRVAIVGPADTGQSLKEEIDSYDVVVRTNVFSEKDYLLENRRIGSRVDVSYFTRATAKVRKRDLIEFGERSDAVFVFRNEPSVQEFGKENLRLQDRIISNNICNFMPVIDAMHAVQRITWDLLKYGPSELKVFNVNFFVGEMYHDKYRPQGKVPGLKSLGIGHDPLQSFMFSKRLHQLGVVDFDNVASEVLKMSEDEYVGYLQNRFGLAWKK